MFIADLVKRHKGRDAITEAIYELRALLTLLKENENASFSRQIPC
jgi:hypothetical protein